MTRYVQKGDAVDYRPTEAVTAGDVIVQGSLIGVARLDIEAGTLGSLAVVGVFDVPTRTGGDCNSVRESVSWQICPVS